MTFLLLNLALGFYNVGTIWAHEVDIFRTWQYIGADFHRVQEIHWRKLPYWVLAPVAVALAGSVALFWYHPAGSPQWAMIGVFGCQFLSFILTATTWGRWQAALSRDPLGSASPYLRKILRTHWLRTALITGSGFLLLAWTIVVASHAPAFN
jgi:hypothetical protein